MLKFVCVSICVCSVPMSLYEKGSIPEGRYIHLQGTLLLPGSMMCLSLKNVCGAHRALVTGFQTTTCKGNRERTLLYEQSLQYSTKSASLQIVFLGKHNGISENLIYTQVTLQHFSPNEMFSQ